MASPLSGESVYTLYFFGIQLYYATVTYRPIRASSVDYVAVHCSGAILAKCTDDKCICPTWSATFNCMELAMLG